MTWPWQLVLESKLQPSRWRLKDWLAQSPRKPVSPQSRQIKKPMETLKPTPFIVTCGTSCIPRHWSSGKATFRWMNDFHGRLESRTGLHLPTTSSHRLRKCHNNGSCQVTSGIKDCWQLGCLLCRGILILSGYFQSLANSDKLTCRELSSSQISRRWVEGLKLHPLLQASLNWAERGY